MANQFKEATSVSQAIKLINEYINDNALEILTTLNFNTLLSVHSFLMLDTSIINEMNCKKAFAIHKFLKKYFNKIIDLRYLCVSTRELCDACDEFMDYCVSYSKTNQIGLLTTFNILIDINLSNNTFLKALFESKNNLKLMDYYTKSPIKHVEIYAKAMIVRSIICDLQVQYKCDNLLSFINDVITHGSTQAIDIMTFTFLNQKSNLIMLCEQYCILKQTTLNKDNKNTF